MRNAVEQRQGPSRLPVRRLARDRQDVDRKDPRPLAQLRQRARRSSRAASASRARTIANSTSLDVIEMDAASNNSVDDIRDLREKVGFAPALGPLEGLHPGRGAHALDRGLERLPEDARGAAAQHDLRAGHDRGAQGARRRSSTAATASTSSGPRWRRSRPCCERIADAEGIEADDRALAMIARSAAGSFRDAIGTLDQLVTYGGKQVAFERRARGARRRRRGPDLRRDRRRDRARPGGRAASACRS